MAQKIDVRFIDDLDGTPAEGTVTFGLDGSQYDVDLSEINAKELRGFLARYIDAGRRQPRKAASAPSSSSGTTRARVDREQTQAIRDWARANGHQISDRGRVPKAVVEAYNAAH